MSQSWQLLKHRNILNILGISSCLLENSVLNHDKLGFTVKVHLANVYSTTCFSFVSCKYSFVPCQDLRSQKHEEAINISMEGSLWNLEFGIIFASQAQKPPRQACLLIAFNFPLKQCLFLNKRLIQEGSVCRVIYTQLLPPFHSEASCVHVPTPETSAFSSSRKIASGHQSLQLN